MAVKKPVRIKRIRLIVGMPIGAGAIIEQSIGTDSRLFGVTDMPRISFDDDDRFIRVEVGDWNGLIPLSNVGMVQLETPAA